EQEGQQTETEATGAPQKHHYTLNQQVGSITNKALSIYLSLFKAVSCFFIFAMHKKLSDSRALLLKLAEDKNTGCMPYL
ncbi:hypothetical protein M1891_16245, partial [Klebsiella pneumoniae]|nr:hypothetical protein [Klebsiella pneumoniae]